MPAADQTVKRLTLWTVVLVVGMLSTGTLNTITKKVQNDAMANGTETFDGQPHKFTHPWFQTWLMFLGEMLCLVGFGVLKLREWSSGRSARGNADTEHDEANLRLLVNDESVAPDGSEPVEQACFQWILIFPTALDLTGTTLAGIGLLYINASVWQMLRGSMVVFSGILSVIFLDLKMTMNHYYGMFLVVTGLVCTGYSSFLKQSSSSNVAGGGMALGFALTLLGIFVNSCQFIVEELFLKKKKLHALNIVGMEGFFGAAIMSVIVMPATYFIPHQSGNSSLDLLVNSFHDDSIDAFVQMGNNHLLLGFCLLYVISIAFFNFFGVSISKELSAVHRTLIDATRTICVWGVQILIYYFVDKRYGEPWSQPASLLQLFGFAMLVTGTLIYNKSIDIPCFKFCDWLVEMREKRENRLEARSMIDS